MRAGKDACLHHVNFACQRLICVAIFLGEGAPVACRCERERQTPKTSATSASNDRERFFSSSNGS